MLETGVQKTVTEPYLVDALSFTEAEARIIEEIKPYISGEFTISDIKRVKYSDTFINFLTNYIKKLPIEFSDFCLYGDTVFSGRMMSEHLKKRVKKLAKLSVYGVKKNKIILYNIMAREYAGEQTIRNLV